MTVLIKRTETGLKAKPEALITAAQDQAENTEAVKAKTVKILKDPKCRPCQYMVTAKSYYTRHRYKAGK